jgi:glutamine synthetase
MTEAELEARKDTFCDIYSKKVEIEARILADLTANHIMPIAIHYESRLLDNVSKMKNVFPDDSFAELCKGELDMIRTLAEHLSVLRVLSEEMEAECDRANTFEDDSEKANAYRDRVVPYLDRIRVLVDDPEMIVDDEMWPLPKYREPLFIR